MPRETTNLVTANLNVPCDTNYSVTSRNPGLAVVNLDEDMCNHSNLDQFIHERVDPVRNQRNVHENRNHVETMDVVTSHHPKPSSAVGFQYQSNYTRNPKHTSYLVNPVIHHPHPSVDVLQKST